MTHRNLAWIIVLVGCLGCGGPSASYDATVQGTVTVDGELAPRGRVVFHPVGEGPPAYGSIFPNGTYSLRVGQGDLEEVDGGQIPSGEYIATVVVNMPSVKDEAVGEGGPPKPGARLTAAKYADKATSDLRVSVKPGLNVVPLELEGVAEAGSRSARARGGGRGLCRRTGPAGGSRADAATRAGAVAVTTFRNGRGMVARADVGHGRRADWWMRWPVRRLGYRRDHVQRCAAPARNRQVRSGAIGSFRLRFDR